MKKYLALCAVFVLSACSSWSEFDWSWSSLNPWADKPATENSEQQVFPENVNKYLWQAATDKLAFMGISRQNILNGQMITNWKAVGAERFQVTADILSGELRADALNVRVAKEVQSRNGWIKAQPSADFAREIERAIIRQAKILYINDKNKE